MARYATVHAAMFHRLDPAVRLRSATQSSVSYSQAQLQPQLQQQVHWCTDGSLVALAYAGPEYELYALFDSMVDKETATKMCHRLSVWIKGQQTDLFMPL